MRFALRKLRDPALAEDAVHDVIEAVLSGRARFGGRAALRSWLTAVLKNKIVDMLRRGDQPPRRARRRRGRRRRRATASPATQPRPDEIAEQRQELARVLAGIDRLPPTLRDAMRLRIVEDRSTESVCAELGISEENLFVRVHRAQEAPALLARRAARAAAAPRAQIIAAGSMSSLEKRVTLRGSRCALEPGFRPSRSRSASHSGRGISTST